MISRSVLSNSPVRATNLSSKEDSFWSIDSMIGLDNDDISSFSLCLSDANELSRA